MTREQLHGTAGFHPASLLAAAAHLRALMEPHNTPMEPTAQIVNGAEVNGYLKALRALEAAAKPKPPEADKTKFAPYSQPAESNQNRP